MAYKVCNMWFGVQAETVHRLGSISGDCVGGKLLA